MHAAFPRSEYYQRVRLPPPCLSPSGFANSVDILGLQQPDQDGSGSPSGLDASISAHAVLSDPAGVSSDHRPCGRLLLPSRYFDPVGLRMCHEALSLHLRYGLGIALSTFSPCCFLHEPKTRFLVEWLVPLARAGVSPAGSARLILAHQSRRRYLFPGSTPWVLCSQIPLPLEDWLAVSHLWNCGFTLADAFAVFQQILSVEMLRKTIHAL
jgi:hypothetical protein